jgi:hypothetical protein
VSEKERDAEPPAHDASPEDVLLAYQEICRSLNVIDDFRARLLALLPLSSGAGIFLLLTTAPEDGNGSPDYLGPIGVIGALISLGLAIFEVREIRICRHLVSAGARLEVRMKIDRESGQFRGRPTPSTGADEREPVWKRIVYPSVPMASAIVYSTVIAAWGYLASVGF